MAEGKHSKKAEKKQAELPEKIRVGIGGIIKNRTADLMNGGGTGKKQSGAGDKKHGILYQMRWFLLLIVEIALVFGITRLIKYKNETKESEQANAELAQAVTFETPAPDTEPDEEGPDDGSDAVNIKQGGDKEHIPFTVDFDYLLSKNSDCVGWLYGEDTPINLAVLQGEDNTYYLFRTFDHVDNGYGTIFLDCNGSPNFEDANNLIFGHNMANESMFGSLKHYREQEYYESHPYLWLATRNHNYRLDVVAGLVHTDDSTLYSTPISREASDILIPDAISNSVFKSDAVYDPEAKYVTLSTCAYEYQGSRLAIICQMTEVE